MSTNPKPTLYVDARLPWNSGIGRYVSAVLPIIARARPDWLLRVGVHVSSDHAAMVELASYPNVEILRTDIAPFSLDEQTRLANLIGSVDLSWFTNYWVPLAWRGRFVATVHDLLHLEPHLFPAAFPKRLLSRAVLRKLQAQAEGLLFVSRFTQRKFEQSFGTPRRAAVVHHGVDPSFKAPDQRDKRQLALSVGALKRHKNIDRVIEAWTAAAPIPPWELVIVHPGGFLRSSINVDPISVEPRISLRSGISDRELVDLYRCASLFLFPSAYEGFGLPLLEAAASGCRIIASTAPALVEVAQGMSVFFVDPEDSQGWTTSISEQIARISAGEPISEAEWNAGIARQATWERTGIETTAFLSGLL